MVSNSSLTTAKLAHLPQPVPACRPRTPLIILSLLALLQSWPLLPANQRPSQRHVPNKQHRRTGPVKATPPTYQSTGDVIAITSMTDLNQRTQNSPIPHAVKVYAPWCGHCRTLKPKFEQSAQDHGQVQHAEIDGDAHPELARELGVKGYPTTLIYPAHSTTPSQTLVGGNQVVSTIAELNNTTN